MKLSCGGAASEAAGRSGTCGCRNQAIYGLSAPLVGAVAEWKEQVDEALGGGLGMVIGEADPLVRFNEYVLGFVCCRHQQVQADYRNIKRASGPNGGVD